MVEARLGAWKLACRLKIALPCWMATTRRVANDRAVADAVDVVEDRHRRVARAQEVGVQRVDGAARRSTVRAAATSAWPATWPPNTRWRFSSGETPRKMLTSMGLEVEDAADRGASRAPSRGPGPAILADPGLSAATARADGLDRAGEGALALGTARCRSVR